MRSLGAKGPDTDDALQRTKRIRRPGAKATDHTELLLGFLAADAHAGTTQRVWCDEIWLMKCHLMRRAATPPAARWRDALLAAPRAACTECCMQYSESP